MFIMASAGQAKTQDNRLCSVCLELFSGREPKILPCYHTFCLACLEKLSQQSKWSAQSQVFKDTGRVASENGTDRQTVTCPTCLKITPVPEGGVCNFQGNVYITNESAPQSYQLLLCSLCDGSKEAKYSCTECVKNFCDSCLLFHNKLSPQHQTRRVDSSSLSVSKQDSDVEISDMRDHIQVIKIAVGRLRQDMTSVQSENIEIKHELTYLQGDHSTVRQVLASVQGENNKLKKAVVVLEGEKTTLREELTQLRTEFDSLRNEGIVLQGDSLKLKDDVHYFQEDSTKLRQELSPLRTEMESLMMCNSKLCDDLNAVQKDNVELNCKIGSLQKEIAQMKKILNNYDEASSGNRVITDNQELTTQLAEMQINSMALLGSEPHRSRKEGRSAPKYFYASICRENQIDHVSGIISYNGNLTTVPVSQFVGQKPLSPSCNKFSIEIVSEGSSRFIGVGLCPQMYPAGKQPGWLAGSVGYHADDGGIYLGNGSTCINKPTCKKGDVMSAAFDFTTQRAKFYKNGVIVFQTQCLEVPEGGFYPIVGMHSPGEVVRLLEKEPWSPA